MDERERARNASRAIGNALLIAGAVLLGLGALAIGVILEDVGDNQPLAKPGLADYLEAGGLYFSLLLAAAVAILVAAGVMFRWLAIQQDARMEEFDVLLDAIEGVEPELGAET
ncbi:MAG TPA: hypothetical protein VFY90_02915 [Tepidiformaceae bacterium]|nr:hypothetical protein [Tepidiformaceae bacterium]